MANVRSSCSGCCSSCNNGFARVTCSSCNNLRSGCGCNSWNNWNNWNNWGNWNCTSCNSSRSGCNCNTTRSGCGCSSCGCNSCGCNSCGCNSCGCNTTRSGCGCSSCCDTWNNGRSGCGCNSCNTCNGFGTLRSVAGPFSRSWNWWTNNPNFPFYTGPCGPCDSCNSCCDDCCDSCCDSCCNDTCCNDGCCNDCCGDTVVLAENCDSCHASATFAAATPVELASGDSVTFSSNNANTNDFSVTQEGIRILRTGTYMVIYTVHVPANETVDSRFALSLNGDRIAASSLDVTTTTDCTTNGYSMHAMVDVDAGDLLKLISLNPVSIGTSSASNVFTLSLSRIP